MDELEHEQVVCCVVLSPVKAAVVSMVEHVPGQVIALRSGDRLAERLAVMPAVSP